MSKAEKFISDYTRNCSNEMAFKAYDGSKLYHAWLTPCQALCAVEIAREEITEKACEYLDGLIELLNDHGHGLKKKRIIDGLKQAMKDETENL